MSAESQFGISAEELRVREKARPKPTTSREFRCDECKARCTRLTEGGEAGHAYFCSRRLRRTGAERERPTLDDLDRGDGQ
ncbi:hypothetical protein [Haloarchaeobius iranensis]|uniref:hypothetical protein n=1 Tax=Haloarchaeobius iranensis TaxID=996166 RepID=UPI0011145E9F|nr:hypothetical protein [Haloarchaeobius iranensis]